MASGQVKIVECVCEAWQALPRQIPAETKVEYLRALIAAGFRRLEAVAFVSPRLAPQLADSEDVVKHLELPKEVELIARVIDEKGVGRALACESIHSVAFLYSISPTHLKRLRNQSPEEHSDALEAVWGKADEKGLDVSAIVAMAFGNPFDDAWDVDETLAAVDNITDLGIRTVSLEDTMGAASPERIQQVLTMVHEEFDYLELGVRLRGPREQAAAKFNAAYAAGNRRFDTALGGSRATERAAALLPSELALETLRGAEVKIRQPLHQAQHLSEDLQLRFGK